MSDQGTPMARTVGFDGQGSGGLAQFGTYLQLFKRLVLASEALSTGQSLYRQFPFAAAGNLDVATAFPGSTSGTIIVDQAVPAALDVTLSGSGPWTVADGAGVAGANNITVKPPAGSTIKGATTYVINTNWGAATFLLYGSNYLVLSKA